MSTSHVGPQPKGVSLRAENLVFSYGAKIVLDGASFTLDNNSRSCLVGSNGAGKSTLLRILARELQPQGDQLIASNLCHTVAHMPQVPGSIGALDIPLRQP
jgi:ATPase subunit of ABC transporter with duplicated ATPase domains